MLNTPPPAEISYQQISSLLAHAPDLTAFNKDWCLPDDTIRWLGRASAAVRAMNPPGILTTQLDVAIDSLIKTLATEQNARMVIALMNRALAHLELKLPAGGQGAFINVGQDFDAGAAFSKVLTCAHSDVLIVDPYMDESVLTDFAVLIPERVPLRLLTDSASKKAGLEPMARKWVEQYGDIRPITLKETEPRVLHDRLLVIDRKESWILTQSIKDFAKRSPASMVRSDDESGYLKINAYEEIWINSNKI